MSDLDNPYSANGSGGEHRPEHRSMPFFPAPPGGTPATLHGSQPLSAQAPPPLPMPEMPMTGELTTTRRAPVEEPDQAPGRPPFVKGRIKIEDEVVEKIAGMAALEVNGVCALGGGGEATRTIDAVRDRIGMSDAHSTRGVKAQVSENEINLDLVVVVEYGSVVIEVAKVVKTNVARIVSLMLGMRVTSVNVTVDDVRLPGETPRATV
ncbi:MAG: Asp23/Gls24 family envelope stress response protein [Streptosporangiaceae bacterium]